LVSRVVRARVDELLRFAEESRDPLVSAMLAAKALELYLNYFIERTSGEVAGEGLKSLWIEAVFSIHRYGFRGYIDKLEGLMDRYAEEISLAEKASRARGELSEEDSERVLKFAKRAIKVLRNIEEEMWPG
jgi:HEPN domain-containing protein